MSLRSFLFRDDFNNLVEKTSGATSLKVLPHFGLACLADELKGNALALWLGPLVNYVWLVFAFLELKPNFSW